jgi:hypothetical protein
MQYSAIFFALIGMMIMSNCIEAKYASMMRDSESEAIETPLARKNQDVMIDNEASKLLKRYQNYEKREYRNSPICTFKQE